MIRPAFQNLGQAIVVMAPVPESAPHFGQYTLSVTYSSNGISYGRNRVWLSDDILNSLPYPSWKGRVSTNQIFLTVVSANKTKKVSSTEAVHVWSGSSSQMDSTPSTRMPVPR